MRLEYVGGVGPDLLFTDVFYLNVMYYNREL